MRRGVTLLLSCTAHALAQSVLNGHWQCCSFTTSSSPLSFPPPVRFHVKTPAEKITELIHDLSHADSGQFAQELSSFCNHAKQPQANYQMLLQETRQCMDLLRKVLLKDHTAELDKRGRKVSQLTLVLLSVCCFS